MILPSFKYNCISYSRICLVEIHRCISNKKIHVLMDSPMGPSFTFVSFFYTLLPLLLTKQITCQNKMQPFQLKESGVYFFMQKPILEKKNSCIILLFEEAIFI